MISEKKLYEIINYYLVNGEQNTCDVYKLPKETLSRYKRRYKQLTGNSLKKSKALQEIQKKYSAKELQAIAKGDGLEYFQPANPHIDFSGKRIRIAQVTDNHYGSIYFNEKIWDSVVKVIKEEKPDIYCHTGDLTEGMSHRPGHIYELTHLGYDSQKEYAIEQESKLPDSLTKYYIDGNHDRWYIKAGNSGAIIVKDICKEIPNANYLGHDEGDIYLNGTRVRLWHGEDGNSYAISYRLQKLIEAFTGGDKPNLILCGHTHKMGYFFVRHVHCISGGSIQKQSRWMRSKKINAHTGFWIIDLWINNKGISKISPTFYPFYE